jgi:hypothetical protein
MKNSCDKTFMLTTSLVTSVVSPTACILQSALATVLSFECGLLA